jgi:ABC-type transport system substrate-binding protein
LTPVYFTISQVGSIVFDVGPVADWNLYTGGFTLTSTPDHLYSLYDSSFASNLCDPSAKSNSLPNNYPLWCDPVYDTQARAGENIRGITLSGFSAAAILGATRGMTVPVYSGQDQFVALNAWNWQGAGTGSSLVTVKGHGFNAASGFLLNMRPVPGYVPANSLYYASGCNPSTGCQQNIIRRSMAQTTLHLSPYEFTTAWEAEPLIQIYDTMLAVDPNSGGLCQTQPGGTAHCIDWMTTSHSTVFDITTGLTTQTWNLRGDIYFHDGQAVTSHDVCFSLLSYS